MRRIVVLCIAALCVAVAPATAQTQEFITAEEARAYAVQYLGPRLNLTPPELQLHESVVRKLAESIQACRPHDFGQGVYLLDRSCRHDSIVYSVALAQLLKKNPRYEIGQRASHFRSETIVLRRMRDLTH